MLVVGALSGSLGWLWWSGTRNRNVHFLPGAAPAAWVVYPVPADPARHAPIELGTVFTRSFVPDNTSRGALLRIAAFRRYDVSLNGHSLSNRVARGRNWKHPDSFCLSPQELRTGENKIEVRVWNSNAPPALWLVLETGSEVLTSDEQWDASYAGATVRKARLAARPKEIADGSPLAGGEKPLAGMKSCSGLLFLFAALSCAICALVRILWARRIGAHNPSGARSGRWHGLMESGVIGMMVLTCFWFLLFANNLGVLPPMTGYDVYGHAEYIHYIQEHGRLPLAQDGWEMHHPPLYYLLCAFVLEVTGHSIGDPGAVSLLRVFGMCIGAGHCWLIWASLRMLFPGKSLEPFLGALLASALPPMLYLSQYLTNEGLCSALMSASVYFCLRVLRHENAPLKWFAWLGACMGFALLTKLTAIVLLPAVIGALAWKRFVTSSPNKAPGHCKMRWNSWLAKAGMALGVCILLCGWHYIRVWRHYDSPFATNWNPGIGVPWWQDDGYRTISYYLRFGESLSYPWYSAFSSFLDGLYSSLWGEGHLAGVAELTYRPPWNYNLMAANSWLALLPTVAVLVGLVLTIFKFLRDSSAESFLVLGLAFTLLVALIYGSMSVPSYGMSKAFYALGGLVPFCAFACRGIGWLSDRMGRLRWLPHCVVAAVAMAGYASIWIVRGSESAILAKARWSADQGQYPRAEALISAQLQVQPDNGELRYLLADILSVSGRTGEALDEARKIVQSLPEYGKGHLLLAEILAREQHNSEAIHHAHQAAALSPGYSRSYELLALLLTTERQWEEVEAVARNGLAINPFSPGLHLALSRRLALQTRWQEALTHVQIANSLKPDCPEIQAELRTLLDLGQVRSIDN